MSSTTQLSTVVFLQSFCRLLFFLLSSCSLLVVFLQSFVAFFSSSCLLVVFVKSSCSLLVVFCLFVILLLSSYRRLAFFFSYFLLLLFCRIFVLFLSSCVVVPVVTENPNYARLCEKGSHLKASSTSLHFHTGPDPKIK